MKFLHPLFGMPRHCCARTAAGENCLKSGAFRRLRARYLGRSAQTARVQLRVRRSGRRGRAGVVRREQWRIGNTRCLDDPRECECRFFSEAE